MSTACSVPAAPHQRSPRRRAGGFAPAAGLVLLVAAALLTGAAVTAAEPPNVVVIMADDMGFSDIGCYGSEIATPHLDALAANGLRFSQFYNGARCCPTRAQLLTGLYAHQTGIGFMEPTNGINKFFREIPEYRGVLNRRCVTLAEVARAAGYQTFMTGKWHIGAGEGQRPLDRGFDRYYGILGGASSFFFPTQGAIVEQNQPQETLPDGFYTTDAFAGRAATFIDEAEAGRPLFLYLAFTAPHWPLHAFPEDIARYRGRYGDRWRELREARLTRQKELGLFPSDLALSPLHPEAERWTTESADDMDLRMAVYAAMVERMDRRIGDVLAALERTGRRENTLILFLSDNGGCAEAVGKGRPGRRPAGDPRSFQGVLLPWANLSNTPFRQFKHWTHEGGIATPLVVSWPAGIPADRRGGWVREPAHLIDVMPTLVELSGATYPERAGESAITPPEGRSLVGLFSGDAAAAEAFRQRPLFWEHEGNRAMRQGRWKLVASYNDHLGDTSEGLGDRTGAWELYDMEADRTELRNLAAEQPERLREMAAAHAAWERRIGVRDWQELVRRVPPEGVGKKPE